MEGYTWVIDLVFNKAFWKEKKKEPHGEILIS